MPPISPFCLNLSRILTFYTKREPLFPLIKPTLHVTNVAALSRDGSVGSGSPDSDTCHGRRPSPPSKLDKLRYKEILYRALHQSEVE